MKDSVNILGGHNSAFNPDIPHKNEHFGLVATLCHGDSPSLVNIKFPGELVKTGIA